MTNLNTAATERQALRDRKAAEKNQSTEGPVIELGDTPVNTLETIATSALPSLFVGNMSTFPHTPFLSIAQEGDELAGFMPGDFRLGGNACLSQFPLALVCGFAPFCLYREGGKREGAIACQSLGLAVPSSRSPSPQSGKCEGCRQGKWDPEGGSRPALQGLEMWVYLLEEGTYARFRPSAISISPTRKFAFQIHSGFGLLKKGRLPYVQLHSAWITTGSRSYGKVDLKGGWREPLAADHFALMRAGQLLLIDAVNRNADVIAVVDDEIVEGGMGDETTF